MDIFDIFKTNKVKAPENFKETRTYDYTTRENRILTAQWLFDQAKLERTAKEQEWIKFNDYYNGAHDVAKEMADALDSADIPFIPAAVPDPFIMVESQISPDVPEPEFHGRDDDMDSEKAKERQKAVKFVIENNRLSDKNTGNERRLRKYGDAFWKAYWDETMPCGPNFGDIRIKDPAVEDIYPDPTAMNLQDGEYIDYVYTMHKFKFWRMYHAALEEQGLTLDDVLNNQYRANDNLLKPYTTCTRSKNDLIQVLEHWYKQPFDAEDGSYESGDIACTIQAGGIELKYIPKYWEKTGKQNKLFPFVHYWCIHDETGFWNRSELDPIIGLVDSADRELTIGILNDALMANDVILVEENALVSGQEVTNMPGSKIEVKQGKMNSVARLGGLNNGIQSMSMVNWLLDQIQRANRNYDTNNGQETSKVTTASGLLQLRADAQVQGELKKADRNKGFCRLYELIDWLCLEFYTDDRLLFIGASKKGDEPELLRYNSANYMVTEGEIVDDLETGEVIIPEKSYYPRVDVTVTTGDGIAKNPASTIQILDKLAAVTITADNYKLLAAELDYLDIPQKQDIIEEWKAKFENNVPQEVIDALGENPELLAAVQQLASTPNNQVVQGDTGIGATDIMAPEPFTI